MRRAFITLAGAFVFASTAHALPLDLSTIDQATLDSLAGANVVAPISSSFDFAPSNAPAGDGIVGSWVLAGEGELSGNYVYLYQIELFADASEDKISGMTIDWTGNPLPLFGGDVGGAFFVSDSAGSVMPFIFDDGGDTLTVIFYPFIGPGSQSYVFGVASDTAPATSIATLLDSGEVFAYPEVYHNGDRQLPVPEPQAIIQFIAGLFVAGFAVRKKLGR